MFEHIPHDKMFLASFLAVKVDDLDIIVECIATPIKKPAKDKDQIPNTELAKYVDDHSFLVA